MRMEKEAQTLGSKLNGLTRRFEGKTLP